MEQQRHYELIFAFALLRWGLVVGLRYMFFSIKLSF